MISSSEGTTSFLATGAVAVDPGLIVTGDTIDGTKVMIENLKSGDALSYTSGSLPSGVSGTWNGTTGILMFSGSATAEQWQTLLRTVTFNTTSSIPDTRTISFSLGSAIPLSGHYYEYISASVSWTTARNNAAARTYFGLQGYLATITSAEENAFIYQKLKADAWIGASDNPTYSGVNGREGDWYWVTGPEAGTLFSVGNLYPVLQAGRYMNWNNLEPNNSGGEHYGEIYSSSASSGGRWNDLPNTSMLGYVVEYGGMSGDPSVQVSTQKNVSIDINYSITYMLDGGTNYDGAPSSYTYEGDTITLGTPSKEGSTFAGWYNAAVGGTRITQIAHGSSGNITLYARWNALQYTVTFKDYDNSVLKTETVGYKGTATPPADPQREGYTFIDWNGSYTSVTDDQTVTATYLPNTGTAYAVRHYKQNISDSGYMLADTDILGGTTDTTATAVARTYQGFHENTAHASRVASGNIAPDGSLVLALYYDREEYEVTFKDYDDSVLKTETVRYEGTATPPANPQRLGYTFSYWNGTYASVADNQTVTAVYTPNPDTAYTVRHYQQNLTDDDYTLAETDDLTGTTDTTATAAAKTYQGFHENTTHASRVASGNIAPDGSLILALYYDRNTYDVTFEDYDNSVLKTETVRYEGVATPPDDPQRTGHTFTGWIGTYTVVIAPQTVTAGYSLNSYTLQFNSMGGSGVEAASVYYGFRADTPEAPLKAGNVFAGWYQDNLYHAIWDFSVDVMPANDVTLYAKWISTPSAPVLRIKTATTIELLSNAEVSMEYRMNGGSWQSSGLFDNLASDTEYSFQTRIAENGTDPASLPSETIMIRTNKIALSASGSGCSITGLGDCSFDPNAELVADNVTQLIETEGSAASDVNFALANEDKKIAELYDIRLLLEGQKIQPDGTIQIRLKLSASLLAEAEHLQIIYISDNGDYEVIPHWIEGMEIVFEVNHLSQYAIVAPLDDAIDGVPITGTNGPGAGVIIGLVVVFTAALISILYIRERREEE
jgi:uncharacterized repeat protein (TIGR02543 family)